MSNFDLTPLFRSSIGFDHMMQIIESTMESSSQSAYPPYNIEKLDDDSYRITMAVAGFYPEELNVEVQDNVLTLRGKAKPRKEKVTYLHKGIATRSFERHFQLADFIKVGEASCEHGLLAIDLIRIVPEQKKPVQIKINSATSDKLLEHKE